MADDRQPTRRDELVRRARLRAANALVGLRHPSLLRRYWQVRNPALLYDIAPREIAEHVADVRVIVEAGAFDGTDTRRLVEQWPDATVYSFEPVPQVFETLCANVADLPNVHPQPFALGAADGTATLNLSHRTTSPDQVSASSSLRRPSGHERLIGDVAFSGTAEVPVLTLDSWMAQAGVERVDVAWLDLQGVELDVLRAAPRARAGLQAAMLEVSRRELYAGAPTYREVNDAMAGWGLTAVLDRALYPFGNVLYACSSPGGRT